MWAITITYGECVENHAGMQKIGATANEGEGFQPEELAAAAARLEETDEFKGRVRHIRLDELAAPLDGRALPAASILIIRGGIDAMLGEGTAAAMYEEQRALNVDKKVYMRGGVKNKRARWNLCFDDAAQEPNYAAGRGRIIAYDDLPCTRAVREALPRLLGPKAADLKAEANYYYDPAKCYIGMHGDAERRRVVAVRLGASLPLYMQWYHHREPIGGRIEIKELQQGDIYVFSEKAAGTDWNRHKVPTLRHAAGHARVLRFPPAP